jgi:NAD(P)-dependent dehydrogenase (short-subunit alcohol dehydrogenase family)
VLDRKNHMVFDLSMEHDTEPPVVRVALITGASRGIGLAIAERLNQDGYHVILTARSSGDLDTAVERLRIAGGAATGIVCDVGDRTALAALVTEVSQRFGRLDVLVNNAGTLPTAKLAETVEYSEWDATMEVNLTAPWFLAARARELMPDGGVIVNIASSASFYPSRGLVAYNVSKAGIVMLTKVLALEWARHGIRVVGVAPGKVDTELLAPIKVWAEKSGRPLNPQRRIGHPDEVAGLVSYLASPAAAYVTGVVVPIDGGELLVASSELSK